MREIVMTVQRTTADVGWDDVTGKPSTFPPSSHTHDGRYYTEAETDALLAAKGTYSKPSGGIPSSDMSAAVQTSLGKADSALQSVPNTYRTAAAQDAIDATKQGVIADLSDIRSGAAAGATAVQPVSGKDLSSVADVAKNSAGDVLTVTKADGTSFTFYGGGGESGAVTSVNGKTGAVVLDAEDVGAGTYSKPDGGIPSSDMASAVQTSLEKADSALQSHQDISGKVDKVAGKGLSTEDYTSAEKTKLAGVEAGADVTDAANVAAAGAQMVSNLVTSVSSASTDAQYPSAKLFYDTVGNVASILAAL